jgi:hypothetical protein
MSIVLGMVKRPGRADYEFGVDCEAGGPGADQQVLRTLARRFPNLPYRLVSYDERTGQIRVKLCQCTPLGCRCVPGVACRGDKEYVAKAGGQHWADGNPMYGGAGGDGGGTATGLSALVRWLLENPGVTGEFVERLREIVDDFLALIDVGADEAEQEQGMDDLAEKMARLNADMADRARGVGWNALPVAMRPATLAASTEKRARERSQQQQMAAAAAERAQRRRYLAMHGISLTPAG